MSFLDKNGLARLWANILALADTKVPTSRTVNGKALASDVTLSASDVGAADSSHTHSNYASTVTTTGTGNAITAISQSGNTITATKGSTFLTAHPTISVSNDTSNNVSPSHGDSFDIISDITRDGNGHVKTLNVKKVTLPDAYTHPTYTARTGVPSANQTPAFGGTFSVSQITSDATGHVTGATSRTITIPSTEASASAKGLVNTGSQTFAGEKTFSNKITASSGITSGGNIVSDTTATDDLGSTGTAWNNVYAKNFKVYNENARTYGALASTTTGTTSAIGEGTLTLGNSIASGTANNAKGVIKMYGAGTYYTEILPNANATTSISVSLPATGGTLALSGHAHSAGDITSGTLSSNRLPTVPIANGGTGATTASAALTNLGAMPQAGGTFTGDVTFSVEGKQVWISFTDENGNATDEPYIHWYAEE